MLPSLRENKMHQQSNNEEGKAENRFHSYAGNAGQIHQFKIKGKEGRTKQGFWVSKAAAALPMGTDYS